MKIERFYDDNLAHASYAILSNGEIALIDPGRNPQPYLDFANQNNASIKHVFETHPHADFVSSHLDIHRETGAVIHTSKDVGADYPHETFDQGDEVRLGKVTFKGMNTPGHSPDSISILLLEEDGREHAVFTGDTLFIGDVGRPDLRETVGNTTAKREELARQMYRTIHTKFVQLQDDTVVYPAHGAGSLCGKNLSTDEHSTIGRERSENWAFKNMSEDQFINNILEDQPFVPKYFGYAVETNKKGAPSYKTSIMNVKRFNDVSQIPEATLIIDTRKESEYKKGHLPHSVNIMLTEKGKFETWVGAIVDPTESYVLLTDTPEELEKAIVRVAKIGYEKNLVGGVAVKGAKLPLSSEQLDVEQFSNDLDGYSIVDVRNEGEVKAGKYFKNAISIPLHQLREKSYEIPTDKPVVVHCAAGYRSAVGSSILESKLKDLKVYDLGEAISDFK